MDFFFYCIWINVANINSGDTIKTISFLIQLKNERLTEILQAVDATFYYRINTIYQFIKPFFDKKNVYFWGLWSF